MPTPKPIPAVFLDRDDTLIDTDGTTADLRVPGDLLIPARVKLLPGVGPALRSLAALGYPLVVISNQGGVSRAMGTLHDVEATNDALRAHLLPHGVTLAACYYCPFASSGHTPPFNSDHPWRKPEPGMYLAAARELHLDLSQSWAVGDKARDLQAAAAAGLALKRCILLTRGPAPQPLPWGLTCPSVVDAARHIAAASPLS